MIDLLDYLRGDVGPDGVNGKPVGVTHAPGQDGIFQVQRDGATRRWFQVKGAWNDPPPLCDWQEHWYDENAIYMAIDTSRPAKDGGPYTLLDAGATRGSKWAARRMAAGDVFSRSPYVVAFDLKTGARMKQDGPVTTWLKLAARHETWRGIADVIELWWLATSPAQGSATEKYFYARGLGLVGFEGPGQRTYPNGVFPDFPPARGIPVLVRKPAPWLPAMPAETPAPDDGDDGFFLLHPCHTFNYFQWHNFGERETPETDDGDRTEWHPGLDITFASGALPPYPITAANAGRVVLAGWDTSGYGNLVKIDHGDRRETLYAHLESIDAAVTPGAQVIIGQRLGNMGFTGRVVPQSEKGRHLHFEYRVNGVGVDPTPLLRDTIPAPVEAPASAPDPVPAPVPPDGLPSPWLTADELRQLIAAATRQRDALTDQIVIYQRALQRATA